MVGLSSLESKGVTFKEAIIILLNMYETLVIHNEDAI